MEEPAGHGIVNAGDAVEAHVGGAVAAEFIFRLAEIHEAADEEIEASIVIVIKPDGAGGPAGGRDAGFGGDVGKRAVAIVVIEDAAAEYCVT